MERHSGAGQRLARGIEQPQLIGGLLSSRGPFRIGRQLCPDPVSLGAEITCGQAGRGDGEEARNEEDYEVRFPYGFDLFTSIDLATFSPLSST